MGNTGEEQVCHYRRCVNDEVLINKKHQNG